MITRVLLIIYLLFYLNGFGIPANKDSLLTLLPEVNPEEKIEIYYQLYESSMESLKYEEAHHYATEALLLAQKNKMYDEEYNALMNIMTAYNSQENYQKAIETGNSIIKKYQNSSSKFKVARTSHELGFAYLRLHIFDKSLSSFLYALQIVEDSISQNKNANLGRIKAIILNNIGNVYSKMNATDKSLIYYHKAYTIRQKLLDTLGIASSLQNLGVCYEKKDSLKKSLQLYQKVLQIRKQYNNQKDIIEISSNIGNIFYLMKQYDSAYHYLKNAHRKATALQAKFQLQNINFNFAYLLLEIGKTDTALQFIQDYYKISQEIGNNKYLMNYYKLMAKYYYKKKDFQKSIKFKDKQLVQKDSLFSKQLSDKISALQIKYELENKEKKIQLLNKNNEIQAIKIQQYSFQLLFVGLLLVLTVLIFLLVMNRRRLKQQHLKTELKRKNLEIQQKLVRNQMNPHFIFNSLNSIQSYISSNDNFTAMTYLSKFATLIRSVLDDSRKKTISIQEEINTLVTYIQLEQLRFKDKFTYSIILEEGISPMNHYIPPLIIQTFVENAIKHGFNHQKKNGKLEISFILQDKFILCSVQDNGIGRAEAAKIQNGNTDHHQSLGIKITKERLECISKMTFLNSRYEIIDLMDENQQAKGTKVLIYLPYERD